MDHPTQAAGYIRVSTEDQTEYSPQAQQRALEQYARQHQLTLSPEHLYIDAGLSGRKAETRPAFMAMIAAAKATPPPFSVILVHKFDRFARSREDSIVYKSLLRRQCGVQVISVTEHWEDDRMGVILEAMLEAMAEYYSMNLAEEVRKGMAEKARRGELQTVPPFGYQAQDNTLHPVPQEADLVKAIYRRFLEGASIRSIARWTQSLGAVTHRGNPLDSRRVRYILSNPVYTGCLRWQNTKSGDTTLTKSQHPPLVDLETFQAAQVLLQRNQRRYGAHARPYEDRKHWLSGLVRCAACGGTLVFSQPHYFKCGRYVKGRCSHSQHVPAQALEEAVLRQLRADAAWSLPLMVHPLPQAAGQHREELERELAGVQRKLSRLREAFLCGAESPQEYKEAKQVLEEQRNALQTKLDTLLSQEEGEVQGLQPALQQALDTLTLPSVSPQDQYRAASQVLSHCVWDRDSRTLRLVYRPPCTLLH